MEKIARAGIRKIKVHRYWNCNSSLPDYVWTAPIQQIDAMRTGNLAKYAEYIALGAHIAATMVVPVIIGIYIDKKWEITPWGLILGMLMGFGGLISIVIKLASKTGKTEYKKKKKYKNG